MNKATLVTIVIICWICSIFLSIFETFWLAGLERNTNDIIAFNNNTYIISDLKTLRDNINVISRIECKGSIAISAVICLYITFNSFSYFSDWCNRVHGCRTHKIFWCSIFMDVIGLVFCFIGLYEYGAGNSLENGTVWIFVGMLCIAVCSYLIIHRYEEILQPPAVPDPNPRYHNLDIRDGLNPYGYNPNINSIE